MVRGIKCQKRLPGDISIPEDTANAAGQGPEQAAGIGDALCRWPDTELHSNLKYAATLISWNFHHII